MIETVQERQRGAYNFENYYDNLCALQDTCPIPAVKAHLNEAVLDINGDRIRQQDWQPIFNSIKINKSLKFIAIRSYFQLNMDDDIPEKKAKVMRSRIPVIRTKEMTAALCKSIRDCLASTESLECLELQGIHLRESHISLLGQGIMKNSTLKHLSLECCRVADQGLAVLCAAMKMAGNISTLNLTSCSLSPIGIRALADLIKFQAMSRHNEAWKESLRYRWANFDTMIGIRRMTLNRNLTIGDEGATLLADSLKDDLWVKAIDLQECGLSSNAVRAFLKVLKFNSTLIVLDLRRNPLIDRDLLKSVTEQVLINGYGKEIEYQWLRVEDTMKEFDENYDRHPRSYYNGPSKPLEPETRPVFKPAGRLRSRSASSIDRRCSDRGGEEILQKTPRSSSRGVSVTIGSKGQPWRTADRATRYKGYPPNHVPGKHNLEEHYETTFHVIPKEKKPDRVHNHPPVKPMTKVKEKAMTKEHTARTNIDEDKSSSIVSPLIDQAAQHPPLPDSVKDLKTEIYYLRTQLDKYKNEKNEIDQTLKEIYNENVRLRNTIQLMSKTHSVMAQRTEKSVIMQDDAILETIENSFQQFNAFLDMLRQSGFSRIVTAAGMDNFTTSKHIMERIGRSSNAASNESIGSSVSSVKRLGIVSDGSNRSPSIDKRRKNKIEIVNNEANSHMKTLDNNQSKLNGRNTHSGHDDMARGDGDSRRDRNSRIRETEDNSALEFVGWKDGSRSKQSTIDNVSNRASDNDMVELQSWTHIGKGKPSSNDVVNVNDFGSENKKDDKALEFVGWKNYDSAFRPDNINRAAGDQGEIFDERRSHDTIRNSNQNLDRTGSFESIDEPAEISEIRTSSYHSDANRDNEKQAHHIDQYSTMPIVPVVVTQDLNVEDCDSFTEDSENGLANDPAADCRYYQQGSLDAAQELSTDTSFNDAGV